MVAPVMAAPAAAAADDDDDDDVVFVSDACFASVMTRNKSVGSRGSKASALSAPRDNPHPWTYCMVNAKSRVRE
jgi:hypothetical protein